MLSNATSWGLVGTTHALSKAEKSPVESSGRIDPAWLGSLSEGIEDLGEREEGKKERGTSGTGNKSPVAGQCALVPIR